MINKLITAGDGYAYNHHWPMWTKLLASILNCKWTNLSTVGAGNEAISSLIQDQLSVDSITPNTLIVVGWTIPNRLDLLINDNDPVVDLISQDPVYNNNYITTALGKKYWCSSASTLPFVHEKNNSLTFEQHCAKSCEHIIDTTQKLLESKCQFKYIFTYPAPWAQHLNLEVPHLSQQTHRYISKYVDLDVGEIQPVSSIHLDYLEQFILPGLDYDRDRFNKIKEAMIRRDTRRINLRKAQEQNQ